MPRAHVNPQRLAAFAAVRDVDEDRLRALAAALPPIMLRLPELEVALQESGIVEQTSEVARALFELASFTLEDAAAPERSILERLTEDVRSSSGWSTEQLDRWARMAPLLSEVVATPGMIALAKAVRLQYDHTNILTETHVITDVRPVFDRDATKPVAAIICHTLRFSYHSDGRHHHLALAVDTADLQRLARDVTRALRKADVMKAYLKEPSSLPTGVAGDEDAS